MKKAQVSIFISVGLLLMVVFGLVYVMISGDLTKVAQPKLTGQTYIQQCAEQSADEIFFELGLTAATLSRNINLTSYAYYDKKIVLLEKDKIKKIVETRIDKDMKRCIMDYSGKDTISDSKREINVIFATKDVIININHPYTIKNKEQTYSPESMTIKLPIRFDLIYDNVEKILKDRMNSSRIIDSDALKQDYFDIEVLDMGGYELWAITDHESRIYEKAYVFMFAVDKD